MLRLHGVTPGPKGRTAKDAGTFYGDAFSTVPATHGGTLALPVSLRDKVKAGQKVAIQRDAMIEPGARVMQILHDRPDPACDGDGCGEQDSDYVE